MAFPRNGFKPHLIRGPSGLAREITRLREDVADAIDGTKPTGALTSTYISSPPVALDVNTDALAQVNNPIMEWSCATGDRTFDPSTATTSMAFTFWKSTTAAHKITILAPTGWTTDAGLNTNFDVPNSSGSTGQWLVRIDLPRKRVNVIPAS